LFTHGKSVGNFDIMLIEAGVLVENEKEAATGGEILCFCLLLILNQSLIVCLPVINF